MDIIRGPMENARVITTGLCHTSHNCLYCPFGVVCGCTEGEFEFVNSPTLSGVCMLSCLKTKHHSCKSIYSHCTSVVLLCIYYNVLWVHKGSGTCCSLARARFFRFFFELYEVQKRNLLRYLLVSLLCLIMAATNAALGCTKGTYGNLLFRFSTESRIRLFSLSGAVEVVEIIVVVVELFSDSRPTEM